MHRRAGASLARALCKWGSKALAGSEQGAAGLRTSHMPVLAVISRDLLPAVSVHGAGQVQPLLGSPAVFYSSSAAPPSPGAPPSAEASVITVQTVDDFKAVLSLSQQAPVVVDMWATWYVGALLPRACGHCFPLVSWVVQCCPVKRFPGHALGPSYAGS
jgi:hypothetical protein